FSGAVKAGQQATLLGLNGVVFIPTGAYSPAGRDMPRRIASATLASRSRSSENSIHTASSSLLPLVRPTFPAEVYAWSKRRKFIIFMYTPLALRNFSFSPWPNNCPSLFSSSDNSITAELDLPGGDAGFRKYRSSASISSSLVHGGFRGEASSVGRGS